MITAGIASIPSRVDSLRRTIDSLSGQVDMIIVVLNGHTHVPGYFDLYDNLYYEFADNSKGDAMKFIWADWVDGYYLGCDDDLTYPPGYADYMITKCQQHACPVSLHGKVFQYPVHSYHSSFIKNYHCRSEVVGDHKADVIGTGVCCFDTSEFKICVDDFHTPNMADLWFAMRAKEQNIPLMVVGHKAGWLGYMEQPWTIWRNKPRDGKETEVINQILRP